MIAGHRSMDLHTNLLYIRDRLQDRWGYQLPTDMDSLRLPSGVIQRDIP
jgi:hypothetical protein